MKVYGHPRCSTVKKALKVLDSKNIAYEYFDLTIETPTVEELRNYHKMSNLEIKKFLNTSGILYREMGIKDKIKEMSDEEVYKLLNENGMLIKRPLLVDNNTVIIGFKEDSYQKL